MAPSDSDAEGTNPGETPRPNGVSTRKTPPGMATPTPERGQQLRDAGYYLGLGLVALGCWELLLDGHLAVGAGSLAAGIVLLSITVLIDRRRTVESARDERRTETAARDGPPADDDRSDANAARADPDRTESGRVFDDEPTDRDERTDEDTG